MTIKIPFYIFLFFLILITNFDCKKKEPLSDKEKAMTVIDMAGGNSEQLEKTIKHYQDIGDSLKLKAAYFLIANLPGKGFYHYDAINGKGDTVDFDKYCSSKKINFRGAKMFYEDSARTTLTFKNRVFIADLTHISTAYLIENIDFAFKSWKLPLARNLTFDQFKELILPYRVEEEPLQAWRKAFFEKLIPVVDSLTKLKATRFQAAKFVNDSLIRNYWFRNKVISFFPGELSLSQMESIKGGRCEDLNVFVGYWLRTLGVPFATEYTPYWGNSDGGHSWLGVLDESNRFAIMNAIFDNPKLGGLPFDDDRPVKIFRRTYKISNENFKKFEKFQVNPLVDSYDVTSSYIPVATIRIVVKNPNHGKVFLGVLNKNFWKPVKTETIELKNQVIFKNIGTNCLYAPIIITAHNKTVTIGNPFLLSDNSKIYYIESGSNRVTANLDVTNFKKSMGDQDCEIFRWDNEAQRWSDTYSHNRLPSKVLETIDDIRVKERITFTDLPSNSIYRIVNLANNRVSRPFIYNPESKIYMSY